MVMFETFFHFDKVSLKMSSTFETIKDFFLVGFAFTFLQQVYCFDKAILKTIDLKYCYSTI